ncbi:MAG: alpha/beta hydrolase [Alphaproteobacteria bacterium]|jgi:acetyl esterase|nr:lipase [Rhodospirillaceae bacterium]MDP6019834.1 alpha/beta hydrolase [Alphaproteobacteria bacterium]MDP6254640.1 alpha/beta hydrolase [Alphaproteobacteria bacterium]MDP7053506.1 alpha/beta hydrolase [Alphaproteobacteria bacterium]MDP7230098.1 alpha/beta hydrolase [Alphaproteobacteria bacterium]|tara:strand:+ start:6023 stop:6976 length:954 start_codon:yes stop_codon:yes gene_type:complete
MTLHAQVKYVLELVEQSPYPELHTVSAQEARDIFEETAPALNVRPEDVYRTEDRWIDAVEGDILIRIYTPYQPKTGEKLPILVFYHGGGFVIGSLDSYDSLCRVLANMAKCIVVSVDYRLAPEHKFPTAVDDGLEAYQWVSDHAHELDGDNRRIAIAGDSAGGNITAVTAIGIRDEGDIPPLLQILIYPVAGGAPETPSHHEFAEGMLLTRATILWFYDQYLEQPEDAADPRFAPLLAKDLSGLAPALVIVAGFDPLRDEGIAYAERLHDAGVKVELAEYDGMVHGFVSLADAVDQGKVAIDQITAALRDVFAENNG